MVRSLNLDGDGQVDLTVHGGADKAVYVYAFEHYEYWQSELPDKELTLGIFGENFTVTGFREEESLEAGDYTLSNGDRAVAITSEVPTCAVPTTQTIEVEQLVEELSQLKQRMREYDRLFHRLGLNENYVNQQLGA